MGNKKQELENAILKTMKDIEDVLKKSNSALHKADPSLEEAAMIEEELSAPVDEAPAAAPDQDPALEEAPAEEDFAAQVAQDAQAMSDEELQMILEILASELESRKAPVDEAPAAAPDQDPAPSDEELQLSKSKEFEKMMKSISSMKEEMETLKKGLEDAKKVRTFSSRPAATTSGSSVLRKSASSVVESQPKEKLNKQETIEFLINQQKMRNPIVDSRVITMFNNAKDEIELDTLKKSYTKKGISFPE